GGRSLLPPLRLAMPGRFPIRGGNLLGRWSHTLSSTSEMGLQMYYDRTVRNMDVFQENRHNFDLDFQHRFPLGGCHDIVWGLGYRLTSDDEGNTLGAETAEQLAQLRALRCEYGQGYFSSKAVEGEAAEELIRAAQRW